MTKHVDRDAFGQCQKVRPDGPTTGIVVGQILPGPRDGLLNDITARSSPTIRRATENIVARCARTLRTAHVPADRSIDARVTSSRRVRSPAATNRVRHDEPYSPFRAGANEATTSWSTCVRCRLRASPSRAQIGLRACARPLTAASTALARFVLSVSERAIGGAGYVLSPSVAISPSRRCTINLVCDSSASSRPARIADQRVRCSDVA